jgi:excinuclease ABC subunit C
MVASEDRKIRLLKKIDALPNSAGVYIFKATGGKVLYIGKSARLRKRVSSYFSARLAAKQRALVSKIEEIDYVITPSESLALLKEAELIKEYLPPYNTALRDDKSYPFICISEEEFPLVWICRRPNRARWRLPLLRVFGPYTNVGLLQKALKALRRIFGFRSCHRYPKKPCLYYRLGSCPAPCAGKITATDYRQAIEGLIAFLEGRHQELFDSLLELMEKKAAQRKFEEAASLRNRICALGSILPQAAPLNKKFSAGIKSSYPVALKELKAILGLKVLPERIEAFDVSNVFGTEATASLVYFYKAQPLKNNYRRFRIKTIKGIDDYAMLKEALLRRYHRLIKERIPLPDLVVIDGGKGHLNVARQALGELKLNIPLISIAKEKEEIFLPDKEMPLRLSFDSEALHLVQQIRDEAHRFALAYHHILRKKKTLGRKH